MTDTEQLKILDKRESFEEENHTKYLPSEEGSITDIVLMAMQKNYQPELIEKMMDLAERHQKNIARQAFYDDLANFKAEAPTVKKDKYNDWFKSYYTSLGNLLDTYNPVLGKHGLSISFPSPEQTDTTMTVECRLTHRLGHSESISLTAPIDKAAISREGKKSRNAIQDIKSTFTYLRSATCEAILGVAGTEETIDDDGNSAGIDYISDKQLSTITDMINDLGMKEERFLALFGIESLDKLPESKFNEAINALKDAKKKKDERSKDK